MIRVLSALACLVVAGAPVPTVAQSAHGVDIVVDCAPCHGVDGIAKDRDVPHLAGQNEGYLYNQMKAFHTGKRPHKEMKAMSRQLTDSDMQAIARYFAALPPR